MINLQLKKGVDMNLPKADPSFYRRFHMAWINFQENELESRLQTVNRPKNRKPRLREAF